MKIRIPILVLAFVGLAFVGYQLHRRTRTSSLSGKFPVADVALPCVRLYDNQAWEGIETLPELESMPSGRYMNRRSDPLLIDAQFRILEMTNLKASGSELSLLLSGPRRIHVTFELKLQSNQSETRAKSLLLERVVNDQAEGAAEVRNQLRSQPSLAEMLKLLRHPPGEIEMD